MEGLGAAASIIAVIELSAKVASLCFQYSVAVKHAEKDITRLQKEVKNLTDVLEEVQELLDSSGGASLSTSQKLLEALNDCSSQLQKLDKRLQPDKIHKAMGRLRIRALKWPLESKEVDKIITRLERFKQAFSLALQVDQT